MTREDVIAGYLINSPKVIAEMLYDTIAKYEKKLKNSIESETCDGCKYYIELVNGKPETMLCGISFDCIRKYKPKDRHEPKG